MIRGVGLRSAVAINVATMIGAGPFITLPLVVASLHGVSAVAWVLGAFIAVCDGLVWAELGSRFPRSGGTYTFLREAFGPRGPGRFVGFLFIWQFLFWAPLVIASGYIGFAQYAGYLVPALAAPLPSHALAVAVGVVTLIALYRPIPQIARTALVLGAVAVATLVLVALAGLSHPYAPVGRTLATTVSLTVPLAALGPALVITLYDYAGYGDVCSLGDEVIAPARTIPRAVVLSVFLVGSAYVLLNLGVAAAIPAPQIEKSTAIAAVVAERAGGTALALIVTGAVLITAFASTYGLLLAAARVPFAAARDGEFLAPFAQLHATGKFPAFSLLFIGLTALPASLLPLDQVINALTAGIVIVQGVGQVVALGLARRAQPDASYRVPLYPVPALLALGAWLYLFSQTGAAAIVFGLLTLAVGAIVYFVRARLSGIWPFATSALILVIGTFAGVPAAASANRSPTFGHAAIVRDDYGEPVLRVDGKPFFFLGGAFFYERIPRSRWRATMESMRALGANTLDLYVPWNWHELADGDFDFDGRTSPRRDLREVLRLGKELGFFFIVRPGPVIRNEWRNGGYPAWLLQQPQYHMELHDVLEGRYPATATLQNAHSDAAAAEWLANPIHLRYASRWLHSALAEFRPVADRVLAVQLDDDQGAYLDNDTFPAPNLHRYLAWLQAQARDVVGPLTPAFINTYEMKVPSSSAVWAMGNWYQSDALAIGDHDRAELAFATAILRTQRAGPLAYSEFQAGWLAGPGDPLPRPADPTNTTLALGELAGWGLKGLIDFPLHDTLAPFGWEAPFSNALYAWDAAYTLDLRRSPRWKETAAMFRALAFYGPALAQAHRVSDVAVVYDGRQDAFHAAGVLKTSLAACRARGVACDVIDPESVTDQALRRFRYVVIPAATYPALAARAERTKIRVATSVDEIDRIPRFPGITVLDSPHGTFLVVENWSDRAVRYNDAKLPYLDARTARIAPFVLAARESRIIALNADLSYLAPGFARGNTLSTSCPADPDGEFPAFVSAVDLNRALPLEPICALRVRSEPVGHILKPATGAIVLRRGSVHRIRGLASNWPSPEPTAGETGLRLAPHAVVRDPQLPLAAGPAAYAFRADVFADGAQDIVLQNARVLAIAAPEGGARIVAFGPYRRRAGDTAFEGMHNVFDATGALRDDVLMQPPPSKTDRIAAYTHLYPAGMFNRAYGACTFANAHGAGAHLAYDAPDVVPNGARFERVVALGRDADRLIVDERFTPADPVQQRLVSLSSLVAPEAAVLVVGETSAVPANRATPIDPRAGGFVLKTPAGRIDVSGLGAISVAWRPGDVESASWAPAQGNGTLRLVFAPGGWRRVTFLKIAGAPADAQRAAEAERQWVDANPPPKDGEVAKRYTQSPQKRPSESSCGFESHLPQ